MAAVTLAVFGAAPVWADGSWALLPEQASCLLDNLEEYRASGSDPVVIFIRVCPVVDRMAALQALQQNNSALPRVTEADDGTPLDEVIVYLLEELECLASIALDTSNSPVLLPRTPCVP